MKALGKEPDPDKMPLRDEDFPYEVQTAFFIHSLLPDVWDGAGGNYFGKNWNALGTILDVYEVENSKDVILFLRYIDSLNIAKKNKDLAKQRKREETKNKGGQVIQRPPRLK